MAELKEQLQRLADELDGAYDRLFAVRSRLRNCVDVSMTAKQYEALLNVTIGESFGIELALSVFRAAAAHELHKVINERIGLEG